MTSDKGSTSDVTLAHLPQGLSVDLFGGLGALLSGALDSCGEVLVSPTTQGASGPTASVVMRTGLSQRQLAQAMHAAAAQLDPDAAALEANGAEPVTVGRYRNADGEESIGLGGGADAYARQIAASLAAAMLPAMEAMGARNYLAWDLPAEDGPLGAARRWELVIRRPDGLTPHQARARYEEALRWIVSHERDDGKRRRVRLADITVRAQAALDAVSRSGRPS